MSKINCYTFNIDDACFCIIMRNGITNLVCAYGCWTFVMSLDFVIEEQSFIRWVHAYDTINESLMQYNYLIGIIISAESDDVMLSPPTGDRHLYDSVSNRLLCSTEIIAFTGVIDTVRDIVGQKLNNVQS